ncbi:MAG TPA: DUF3027 domain-containing protein [Actinomycetota bacterium]|nr:DUF3027 domain-containing protein [Actinomycetota bacterium]
MPEDISRYAYLRATVRLVASPGVASPPILPWGATLDCRIDGAIPNDLGDATVFFEDRRELDVGETATARILPGHPSRWREVSVGNKIELLRSDERFAVAAITHVLEAPTEARFSSAHRTATYSRWATRLNRSMNDPSYREEWRREQCGLCQFWIPIAGSWGLDWGGCSNEASPFDGSVRYEHDGCDEYRDAAQWYGPVEFSEEDFAPS